MTSRPRRRPDQGIELSEERADEYFRLTGTPLQDLEKSKELGEYVPPWKQEVRDEKGRRRLHGAFTGGFSAGYYNTVGSKEGWVPSTFVSSRSERATRKVARPEDFMDQEDLAALDEEQDILDKEEEKKVIAVARAEMKNREHSLDQTDFVSSASEAARSDNSVGARLLQKMGQLSDPISRSYAAPSESGFQGPSYASTTEEASDRNNHMSSLRDITMLQSSKKVNVRGLGYIPEETPKDKLTAKSIHTQRPRLAVGFGLGALNEVEDDDLDIYDAPKDIGQTRLAYEASRADSNGSVDQQAKSAEAHRVLTGFVLSSDRPATERASFLSQEATRAEVNTPSVNSDLASTLRNDVSALPDSSSVFHYISQKDRERLQAITSRFPAEQRGTAGIPAPSITIPFTEPHIAQAALRGFQPFAADPVKQARYHTYLQSQAFPDGQSLNPLPSQKMDEFRKEVESYAKAAQLFKPMTGAIANRFTSGGSGAVAIQTQNTPEGLHRPSEADYAKQPPPPEPEVEKKEESQKAQAARLGMYGTLTREAKPWQPARLLCKRFGVKDPNPEPVVTTTPSANKPTLITDLYPNSSLVSRIAQPDAPTAGLPNSQGNIREVTNIKSGEIAGQSQVLSASARPAVDIYNAIFTNDNEVSDDEEKDKVQIEGNASASSSRADSSTKACGPEKIDLNNFKPTFVPRSERDKKQTSKQEKKDRKKKIVLVSFELDEDLGKNSHLSHQKPKYKPRKKRRHKRAEGDEDEVMWVEKPQPESAKEELCANLPPSPGAPPSDATLYKGRKRAIDFM